MTFWLDLNHSANVTVEVIDSNGQVQACLLDNRRRTARQHVFLWDGYDDFGRLVMPGTYTVRAVAGAPPIKVTSAVQIRIEEDTYVSRKTNQYDEAQHTPSMVQRRRLRQNRKRI